MTTSTLSRLDSSLGILWDGDSLGHAALLLSCQISQHGNLAVDRYRATSLVPAALQEQVLQTAYCLAGMEAPDQGATCAL
jgi:hypothetical protein